MKQQITILLFILTSCVQQNKDTNLAVNKQITSTKPDSLTNNKVKIDFLANKELLDIILLLPDSSFSSWEWKLEDRINWYKEIKANNFYIDDNPDYFNLMYFEPNKAHFTIIDGSWIISIYKTSDNSFVVITDDLVGDGNEINIYKVKSNKIEKYLNEKLIFGDYKDYIKQKNEIQNCDEQYKELNEPIFVFNFLNENKIEIESSWSLSKEKYKDCLLGNAVLYNFNPKTEKFDVEKVYWKLNN